MLGVNTRAQYFKAPISDASFIPGGLWLDVQPKNVIQENVKAPIIFEWGCLHGYSYNMRDSRLIFKLKIQKSDGTAITKDNKYVRPVGAIGIKYFKRVEFYINNVPVHANLMELGPKFTLDTMFEKSSNSVNKDCLSGLNFIPQPEDERLVNTKEYFTSKKVDQLVDWTVFHVKLPLDVFRSGQNFPCFENINYELRLFPQDDLIALNYGYADPKDPQDGAEKEAVYKLLLKSDIKFSLRADLLSHDANVSLMSNVVGKNQPVSVWYRPSCVKLFTIAPDQYFKTFTNVYENEAPIGIYVTFINQAAYMGSRTKDATFLSPGKSFKSLSIYKNGTLIGTQKPLELDLTNNEDLKSLFAHNLSVLGHDVFDNDLFWDYSSLMKGYFFMGCPLRPTSKHEGLDPVMEDSVISGEVHFDPNIAKETLICFWYAVFNKTALKIFYNGAVQSPFSM